MGKVSQNKPKGRPRTNHPEAVTVCVCLDPEDVDKLDTLAATYGDFTRSDMLRMLIRYAPDPER